jgi:hypothetical protein
MNRRTFVGPAHCAASARQERRQILMDALHEMLVEDEILFCGLTLLLGIVTGAVARFMVNLREGRVA